MHIPNAPYLSESWLQTEPDTGFEGFRSNLHFGLQKILYTPLNCTFSALYH